MLTVKNEEQKGKIVVHKQGEKLTGPKGYKLNTNSYNVNLEVAKNTDADCEK